MYCHMLRTTTTYDFIVLGTGYKETIIETSQRRITPLFTIFPDPSSSEKSGTPIRFWSVGTYSSIPILEPGLAVNSRGHFIFLSKSDGPCVYSYQIIRNVIHFNTESPLLPIWLIFWSFLLFYSNSIKGNPWSIYSNQKMYIYIGIIFWIN